MELSNNRLGHFFYQRLRRCFFSVENSKGIQLRQMSFLLLNICRKNVNVNTINFRRRIRNEELNRGFQPKKKRKMTRKKELPNMSSHNDAIFHVVKEKNLSNKINYEILKQMEGDDK